MRPIALLLLMLTPLIAAAQDVAGASDPPLLPRYEGSEIVHYSQKAFEEYKLLVAPAKHYGGIGRNADATRVLEGRWTRVIYRLPAERTPLEAMRNYNNALTAAGFKAVFSCADDACGGRNFNHAAVERFSMREAAASQRYAAARLARPEGDVYAAIYAVRSPLPGGPDARRTLVQVDVVELSPMEERMVMVKAPEMQRELGNQGRVALYGLLFDTDRDTMRDDSRPQLEQIAQLLRASPRLKVLVVGHTDSVGGLEHNRELSARRARSVVSALVRDHGIAQARLTAQGVGMAAPVASNRSEEGRSRNRRVELVELPN